MLSAYSNGGDLPDDYIGNIAKVLSQFPREVAVQACSPIHGVPRQCKQFRPNAGQVYEWCEIRTEPIWERAKLEVPALPKPTMTEKQVAEGKRHVAQCLAKFMENRVVRNSWFDRLTAAEAERKYPGISK